MLFHCCPTHSVWIFHYIFSKYNRRKWHKDLMHPGWLPGLPGKSYSSSIPHCLYEFQIEIPYIRNQVGQSYIPNGDLDSRMALEDHKGEIYLWVAHRYIRMNRQLPELVFYYCSLHPFLKYTPLLPQEYGNLPYK